MAGGGAVRQNAARVQLAAQFNERRQEGYAYTYIFRGRKQASKRLSDAFRVADSIRSALESVCSKMSAWDFKNHRTPANTT